MSPRSPLSITSIALPLLMIASPVIQASPGDSPALVELNSEALDPGAFGVRLDPTQADGGQDESTPAGEEVQEEGAEPAEETPPSGEAQDDSGSDAALEWSPADQPSSTPAGVRHASLLPESTWNLALRYEYTSYSGLRDTTSDISSAQALSVYSSVPQDGHRELTEIEITHGYRTDWTVYATLPHVSFGRTNRLLTGADVDSDSGGFGDIQVGTVHKAWQDESRRLFVNMGLSLPTGSIDETDDGALLPYSMQPGSGTWDLHPGVTWLVTENNWSWGAYGQWRIHINKNSDDWARGDEGSMGVWAAKPLSETVSASARLHGYFWGDVHGRTLELDPTVDPSADKHLQGGDRIDLLAGANWRLGSQERQDQVLSLEAGLPLFEWLAGPQLSTEWMIALRWNVSF